MAKLCEEVGKIPLTHSSCWVLPRSACFVSVFFFSGDLICKNKQTNGAPNAAVYFVRLCVKAAKRVYESTLNMNPLVRLSCLHRIYDPMLLVEDSQQPINHYRSVAKGERKWALGPFARTHTVH